MHPVGDVSAIPFDRLQCQPGELCFDFLERLARVRGVLLASDVNGDYLLIAKHSTPIVQQLTEGENILKMQCVFSNEQRYSLLSIVAQRAVTDDDSMSKTAEMEAKGSALMTPNQTVQFRFIRIPAEQPVKTDGEMWDRHNNEAVEREGTLIQAFVTVQGWLRDGVNLWQPGDLVWVHSPMALMDMAMAIQTATFSQDNKGGTLTVLELVLPFKLKKMTLALGPDAPNRSGNPQLQPPQIPN